MNLAYIFPSLISTEYLKEIQVILTNIYWASAIF